LQIIFIVPMN